MVRSTSTQEEPTMASSSSPKNNVTTTSYEITNGRKLAMALSQFKWYFPSRDKEPMQVKSNDTKIKHSIHYAEEGLEVEDITSEGTSDEVVLYPVSLEKAWDFFERRCLPRRFTDVQETTKGRKYMRAEPGETQPTSLYPVIETPIDDMADFGIGVGMYFKTLQFFFFVTLIAGFLSLPTMIYYQSNEYSPGGKSATVANALNSLSAVCTNVKFQPCPTCTREEWKSSFSLFVEEDNNRLLFSESDDLKFIAVNECQLNDVFGFFTFVTMVFVVLSVYVFVYLQRRYRIELDEGEQTSSDYSIQILNPPKIADAKNPDLWKVFFEERFENVHVTVCTVALNNSKLIKALLRKQHLKTQIKNLLPVTTIFDETNLEKLIPLCNEPSPLKRILCFAKSADVIYNQIIDLDEQIAELSEIEYDVSRVLITFETEEMQRVVLENMDASLFSRKSPNDDLMFHGVTLKCSEPDEPSAIRWTDLDTPMKVIRLQRLCTFGISCVLIVADAVLIAFAKSRNAVYSALMIILLNSITPLIVSLLSSLESHYDESSYTASSYLKITAFRWANTVLVTSLVTPFVDTLQGGDSELINSIRILFTAELLQRPILQMLDYMGHLKRHVLGPRAPDQRRMNLLFMPKAYSIGERYTDVTKVLFLTFFYCTLFPLGYFYAAAILFVYYWLDKFCILRSWKQGAKINAKISLYSTYFLFLTLLAYAVMASYTYSSFPFDNACETDETIPDEYLGTTSSIDYDGGYGSETQFNITSEDKTYKFCNQNIFQYGVSAFPPVPNMLPMAKEWMTLSQEKYSAIFGWALVGIVALVSFSIVTRLVIRFVFPQKPIGKAQKAQFSDVFEIYGYVPQVKLNEYQYPLLICDVDDIDHALIGWSGDYKMFNLSHEMSASVNSKKPFSIVKNWSPGGTNYGTSSPSVKSGGIVEKADTFHDNM